MFYQIFRSPQVKRSAVISNKHGIYELSHKLSYNPTAFSPLGGAKVPTQEKKRITILGN